MGVAGASIPISEADRGQVRARGQIQTNRAEGGIALLISIFILLLISVVAIALIVASGTESSLAGNYRSATGVYYAALAGLEEARGRLSSQDPNSFKTTWTAFYPAPGSTLPIGTVGYVLNPGPSDPPDPRTAYPDTEYDTEFGAGALAAATVHTTLSVWNRTPLTTNLAFSGPLYKWVRINAVSEISLKLADTHPFDGTQDPTPLYYDGAYLNDTNSGRQVYEITALAVLPNASGQSSQKLVQYLAAPGPLTLPTFLNSAPLAALSLSGSPGNSPIFHAPDTNKVYTVKGNNWDCSGNPAGTPVAAIGLFGDYSGNNYSSDLNGIVGGIPTSVGPTPFVNPQLNYTGLGAAPPTPNPPDVEYLTSYPASEMPPAQVDAIAQNIMQNADAVFVPAGGSSTQTAFLTSLGMSPTNIMTVIANRNLDISNWSHDGYGLLLVTGTFTYDPDTNWNGIVLVIGQGVVNNSQNGQYSKINGAMFVAKTRDTSGNLLTGRIGGASVAFLNGMEGYGIQYSSCWIQKAQPVGTYKVLSFHEIAQ
jgi:Tfp pilus assembly protein PilX